MPKVSKLLTNTEIKNIKTGNVSVGGVTGLYYRKRGSQGYFYFRYKGPTGKRHEILIGKYPDITLAKAREIASEMRKQVLQGKDLIIDRKEQKEKRLKERQAQEQEIINSNIITFLEVALEWIQDRATNNYWQSETGEKKTRQMLEKHVFPMLGDLDIEKITPETVRDCLAPIWQNLPSTAKKTKTHINKIFQWAIALKKRKNTENPALMAGTLGVLMEPLQKNIKPEQNFAACAVEELPLLMQQIQPYYSMSAKAVEFAILTATRSQAVRLAKWTEFDLEKGIWEIPKENDKIKVDKRDRTIFLSSYAVRLLKNLRRQTESQYVFPSNQGGHFSDTALTMFLRGLHESKKAQDGVGWIDPIKSKKEGRPYVITMHGTARATFRTWAKDDVIGNNRKFDQEAVELCLLHSKNDGYKGAYDRARLEKERRFIMEEWGKYCYSLIEGKKSKAKR